MLKAVIFDMDDTLYDEIDYCRSGFHAVDEYLRAIYQTDAGAIFEALWDKFNAGNHTTTFNAVLDSLEIDYDEAVIKDLISVYRRHKPDIVLDGQTGQILAELSEKYALAIITDGFLPAQKLKVAALGLEKYFQCIVYTEELGREYWKPHPKGFEIILEKLSAEPKNAVFIADNAKKDFIAPNALGITTIQLIRPKRLHFDETKGLSDAPEHIIRYISDLPEMLHKLEKRQL